MLRDCCGNVAVLRDAQNAATRALGGLMHFRDCCGSVAGTVKGKEKLLEMQALDLFFLGRVQKTC